MGRLVSILGDSVSTFAGCNPAGYAVYYEGERVRAAGLAGRQDTWWAQVAARMGAAVLANASYSGSMVAGEGFPAGCSPERAAALRGPSGEAPDDVLVFMGINDYGWGSPQAQAAARSSAAPASAVASSVPGTAGRAPADAAARFGDAYGALLANVRAVCPGAEVWCCTLVPGRLVGSERPTFADRLRGVPFSAYNGAVRAVARGAGCRVADLAAFGLDYEAVDGTHPTRRGMRQLAELVAAAVEGRGLDPAAFADGGPFAPYGTATWASADPCPRDACTGCPRAYDTSNSWSCVCTGRPGVLG